MRKRVYSWHHKEWGGVSFWETLIIDTDHWSEVADFSKCGTTQAEWRIGPASVWSVGVNLLEDGREGCRHSILFFYHRRTFSFLLSRSHRPPSTEKIIFESTSCQDSRRTHTSMLLLLVCVSVFVGVFVLYLCVSVCVCMLVCHCDLLCDTFLCSPPPLPFLCHSPNPSIHRLKLLVSAPNVSSVLCHYNEPLRVCACVCVRERERERKYVCVLYCTCLIALGGETSFIDISSYCLCCLWTQLPIIQPKSPL